MIPLCFRSAMMLLYFACSDWRSLKSSKFCLSASTSCSSSTTFKSWLSYDAITSFVSSSFALFFWGALSKKWDLPFTTRTDSRRNTIPDTCFEDAMDFANLGSTLTTKFFLFTIYFSLSAILAPIHSLNGWPTIVWTTMNKRYKAYQECTTTVCSVVSSSGILANIHPIQNLPWHT